LLKPFLEAAVFEFAEFVGRSAASDRHSTLASEGHRQKRWVASAAAA
jgi:hypothetical protein